MEQNIKPGQERSVSNALTDLNSRIRALESKYNLLGEKVVVINQSMLQEFKRILDEIKIIDEDVVELKKELSDLKNILNHIMQEMGDFARKENLKVLEKYINLWNPLNFTTLDEVKKLIKEEKEVKEKNGKK